LTEHLRGILEARAAMEEAVRAYFNDEGFVVVTTPALVEHPNLDPNIRPVPVNITDFSGDSYQHWLHTSPELSMKKLLAQGSGSIYQIGNVFRDEDHTRLHRREFSMLEWYRVEADYEDAIRDTIRVVRAVCRAVTDGDVLTYDGRSYDLAQQWEEITMAEAFERYAGVQSLSREDLADALENLGYKVGEDPVIEDLFFRVYIDAVEPSLGIERPTILKDYPSFLGTMARPREDDPHTLERFEVYIAGLELANGYTELTDSMELAGRMEKVLRELSEDGVEGLTIDDQFLEAMADLPPCAGVSVGMDRLAMLALDLDDISQVVYPYERKMT
jgi:lysyl-tRNA synthetase class 2